MKDFLQGKWLGHPPHPAIVHIPSGLWPASLVFDILTNLGYGGNALFQVSFYAILIGLLAGLAAIPFGVADWWDIRKNKPAWPLGVFHMVLNSFALSLWALNLGLRAPVLADYASTPPLLLGLSIAGVLVLAASGYIGGRMVFGYGVSVARQSKDKWREIARQGGGRMPEK
jgi:uncharacterized membrane protein